MTEEQYENLMYAISTLIGLIKWNAKPINNGCMDSNNFEHMIDLQIKNETDRVYKNLTGKLPDSKWDIKDLNKKGEDHE